MKKKSDYENQNKKYIQEIHKDFISFPSFNQINLTNFDIHIVYENTLNTVSLVETPVYRK